MLVTREHIIIQCLCHVLCGFEFIAICFCETLLYVLKIMGGTFLIEYSMFTYVYSIKKVPPIILRTYKSVSQKQIAMNSNPHKITNVMIDVGATGTHHHSVFYIAFCVHSSNGRSNSKFSFPEDENKRTENKMKFWTSSPEQHAWFDDNVSRQKDGNRVAVSKTLRGFIDTLYKENEEIVFYSKFPVIDFGITNALLAEADCPPIYLENDSACPAHMLDMNSFMLGLMTLDPGKLPCELEQRPGNVKRQEMASYDDFQVVNWMMDEVFNTQKILSMIGFNI